MDLPLMLVVELLLLGTVTGFLAGLLGIGGGMMMVPVLTWMLTSRGVDPALAVKMAIATAMGTILFTSVSSVRAHHARGAVRWDLFTTIAPGIVAGGLLSGAAAFALIKGQALALLFALFTSFSAAQMLRGRKPRPSRTLPGPAGRLAAGGVIGFVSGLVGAGGAFISVPFMTWCNVPIREAVGTSAAFGLPIAAASTLGYVIAGWHLPASLPGAFGYVYVPGLLIVALASVMLAPVGARVAHAMDTSSLRKVFAGVLFGIAVYMATQALKG